jgi:flavin-dependent dehydrogenase
VLLAGDAAATADPLFGEGIAYAIISAVAASDAIVELEAGRATDLRYTIAACARFSAPPSSGSSSRRARPNRR